MDSITDDNSIIRTDSTGTEVEPPGHKEQELEEQSTCTAAIHESDICSGASALTDVENLLAILFNQQSTDTIGIGHSWK